ncbi:organomercurial lyase [Nocardia sp. NPDC006630]|uniref:organomercurial lyase n=1 Tax=Nocardia sp. NPDC006630 TaxID=3157181 RepID=UPI0033AB88A7
MNTTMQARFDKLTDDLIAKWSTPTGRELLAAGMPIMPYLLEHGPVPISVADAGLPEADRHIGFVKYYSDRDYDVELDENGDIIGAGISLAPTANHITELYGKRYYNWCMGDAIMFPLLLGVDAPAETICPITGEKITFTVTSTGLDNLSHPDAHMSLAPATGGEIRHVFCNHVNLYATGAAAEAAAAEDPTIAVAPAQRGWAAIKRLVDANAV